MRPANTGQTHRKGLIPARSKRCGTLSKGAKQTFNGVHVGRVLDAPWTDRDTSTRSENRAV